MKSLSAWVLVRVAATALCYAAAPALCAQSIPVQPSESQLRQRLVHQPLYLRGFWMGYNLDFDSAGEPVGKVSDRPRPGPLTLSGVEVEDVAIKGTKLLIHAQRIALVADAQGTLARRPLMSTTYMFGTMQKEYRAKEMVKISIQADEKGSFDAPLQAVFADGLSELASSAPPAWRCYAEAYFNTEHAAKAPADSLSACVDETIYSSTRSTDASPSVLTQPQTYGTREAAELRVFGESEVSIRVDAQGSPIGFQIVRPLGAGLDEDLLGALSQCHFAPAMREGLPVAAGVDFSMQYR